MTAGMITPAVDAIRVSIVSHAEEVRVELHDRRAEAFSLFAELGPPQGEQLARDAWAIGLRALHNAHRTAQEAKLADIGGTLVADIDVRLRAHVEEQHRTLTQVLTAYFDPRDGQVSQRLAAFVDDQGVLARLLQRYVGPSDSVLSDVLARQVGEASPLFKKLSPTESDGLVKLALSDKPGTMLVAKRGKESAFLPSRFWRWDETNWRKQGRSTQSLWFVWDDRQLYKPGEKVHVKGWVRQLPGTKLATLALPTSAPLAWRLGNVNTSV